MKKNDKFNYESILKFHVAEHKSNKGWRTTKKKPWIDINFEIKRNELIKETKISKSLIKNYFLFSEIHKKLMKA